MMGDVIERAEGLGLVHTWADIWGDGEIRLMDSRARGERNEEGYSPSVALPRFSFQYLGAHGPHGLGTITPWAFVPARSVKFSTFNRIPLSPVYLGP